LRSAATLTFLNVPTPRKTNIYQRADPSLGSRCRWSTRRRRQLVQALVLKPGPDPASWSRPGQRSGNVPPERFVGGFRRLLLLKFFHQTRRTNSWYFFFHQGQRNHGAPAPGTLQQRHGKTTFRRHSCARAREAHFPSPFPAGLTTKPILTTKPPHQHLPQVANLTQVKYRWVASWRFRSQPGVS
jgi:hypothetical protein